ncbi:MAG: inorganic phosphate transporter [Chthoniobacteraceae bacterium]
MTLLLLIAVAFLAYSNGANDNFKGVASLFGSGTTTYRTAISWATFATCAGSVCSIFLAQSLLRKFSGKGLVPDALVGSEHFLLAVALGAGLTVILATRFGFPISTTHGLTGAMVGGGLVAVGGKVAFGVLGKTFLMPLLLSPVLAILLGALLYLALRFARLRLGITKESCVCIGTEQRVTPIPQPASVLAVQHASVVSVAVDSEARCSERYAGAFLGINCQRTMDAAHFASSGIVSFARGLNDTPKMAALFLVVQSFDIRWGLIIVAVAIAVGGLLNARRVAETMSHRITPMNHGQGFSANLATGILVISASAFGLPVSTTHVSCGALFGIGLTTRQADPRVISGILLSWLLTLPCAAVLSGAAYWLLTHK